MNAMVSFLAVVALGLLVLLGVAAGLEVLFGIVLPYLAIVLFLSGFIHRVVTWAKSPVPFRIPTTGGQQRSLEFIRPSKLDNPSSGWGVAGRMILEILFFRSLFRNTATDMRDGPRLVYGARKALWLAAIVFHWTFLVIFIRHLRFFTEPVPGLVGLVEGLDGFLDISVPTLYLTDVAIVAALGFLLIRRFTVPQVRYISQAADYFPLFLLLGVVLSGIWIRYFGKTDVAGIKELGMGLLAFSPSVPAGASAGFYLHLFLVTVLIGYFPFSKLMHLGGVFLSPTRNLANNNREVRHVNPWNAPVRVHEFEHWKEEFAEEIAEAGYELKEK